MLPCWCPPAPGDNIEKDMTLIIDNNDPDLKTKIADLPTAPGYCILLDMVDSTKMKQSRRDEWIAYVYNTFTNSNMYLSPFRPLKSVGDELMYYITDHELTSSGYSSLFIFDALSKLAQETETYFKPVRIGAARCEDVYAMTFLPNTNDYYGRDVDLTARLLDLASAREVVINEPFRESIMARYNEVGNKPQFEPVLRLQGPWPVMLKGFDSYINIYKLPRNS